ncbi:hypothetical protein [Methylobacterium sp. BE186]|nr:hypothetical protein [Methylobacterium sp. BE186]
MSSEFGDQLDLASVALLRLGHLPSIESESISRNRQTDHRAS